MIQKGIATFTLDYGKCPKWLFERMTKLGREIIRVIISEYGPEEFIKRISDPVWFQSLGTVLAFDWNASGLTTILTAALKEAIKGREKEFGIFICGGKGKTSRKTPEQIQKWGEYLLLPKETIDNLIYNSKIAAKVDSSLIQDSYQIYHHTFFFSQNKNSVTSWAVVQQGMNIKNQTARRYHWYSQKITDLICEPHSGIITQLKSPTLNLTAKESEKNRQISIQLVKNYSTLIKDLQILAKHSTVVSKMLMIKLGQQQFKFLKLEDTEFTFHPVLLENFFESKYLKKIFLKLSQEKPENYEKLVSKDGVGPKTIRALALVSEIIYGAKPSYEDPARYSFAHGGKDATPFPVDRKIYDETIKFFENLIPKTNLSFLEKIKIERKLKTLF
ncbi:MAG: DUF763 domain-containing protein [Minisyncoccia bacterium]